MTLGERIKSLREARRWSLRDLEGKSGVTNVSITRYETGQQIPRPGAVVKLAKAFGISERELLGQIEKSPFESMYNPKEFERTMTEARGLTPTTKAILTALIRQMIDGEKENGVASKLKKTE